MKMLPIMDPQFSALAEESAQTTKYVMGDAIRRKLFLWAFVSKTENAIKYSEIFETQAMSYAHCKQKQAS